MSWVGEPEGILGASRAGVSQEVAWGTSRGHLGELRLAYGHYRTSLSGNVPGRGIPWGILGLHTGEVCEQSKDFSLVFNGM